MWSANKLWRLVLLCSLAALTFAQQPAPKRAAAPQKDAALEAARHSFMMVSTEAVALFESADSISRRLQSEGSSLHPSTITLRLRIERSLDHAEAFLAKGDVIHADEEIKRANELVNRFSRRIGGE